MARQRDSDSALALEVATIQDFERLRSQLKTFYQEVSLLSKKSPDGAMNKFKLGFINETLKKATALLGDSYRPFAAFEVFAEDQMPTSSDVGMMLSQYLNCMDRFKREHCYWDEMEHKHFWHTKGRTPIRSNEYEG